VFKQRFALLLPQLLAAHLKYLRNAVDHAPGDAVALLGACPQSVAGVLATRDAEHVIRGLLNDQRIWRHANAAPHPD
jgi:hypothetical protein